MERPDELDTAGQTSSAAATAQFTRFAEARASGHGEQLYRLVAPSALA